MNWALILGIGIPIIIFIGVIRFIYRTYNELIWHLVKVDKITGNLDAVLKKKFDLIPALVEIVKGYASHEKGTFEKVTELRSQWGKAKDTKDKIKTANMLEGALSKLLVVQERYPKLKADKSFQNIQKSINKAESEILSERKYYNEIVRRYNVRVKLFPRNIIAKFFGFTERQFFSKEN
ncbi:MAG: LemA family protein [DPANN group archaeon]|nr:LemA family protein [DPANN group archaeon]